VQDFASQPTTAASAVFLKSPADGSVYRLSPDLPPQAQEIPITAETSLANARLRLWVDHTLLAECTTAPTCTAWWALQPGEHRFWAEVTTAQTQVVSPIHTIVVEDTP